MDAVHEYLQIFLISIFIDELQIVTNHFIHYMVFV